MNKNVKNYSESDSNFESDFYLVSDSNSDPDSDSGSLFMNLDIFIFFIFIINRHALKFYV